MGSSDRVSIVDECLYVPARMGGRPFLQVRNRHNIGTSSQISRSRPMRLCVIYKLACGLFFFYILFSFTGRFVDG